MQTHPPIDYRSAYPGIEFYNSPGTRVTYRYRDAPYYSDPERPWLIHYGEQRVSVPQIGYDSAGFRYHPAVGDVSAEGEVTWDWSQVVRGQPPIPWPRRLDPHHQRAQWDPGHIEPVEKPRESIWARFWNRMFGPTNNRDRFTGS